MKLKERYKRAIKIATYNDVEDLHLAERDPEDLNFGHITLISQGDNKWSISFSFIYGVETLDLDKEFLDQAKFLRRLFVERH